jgi:diacylglycerol kinase family enzyme
MNLPMRYQPLERPFAHRTAFLLNANARSVNRRTARALAEIVPEGDLFVSETLDDAERYSHAILRRGYQRVMVGGGDGTLVSAMNLFDRMQDRHGFQTPHVGLLKLGTGNAVAGMLRAKHPLLDAHHVASGGDTKIEHVDMVRTEEGTLTPFAGIGYDGEILNDYYAQQEAAQGPAARFLSATSLGYLLAMITRTVPRHLKYKAPSVRVTSKRDAVYMKHTPDGDVPVDIPAGTVLFDGPAPLVTVSSVPCFGFGFKMFPFARQRAGFMQVRICATPVPKILQHLFTSVWQGNFRHADLHDFLVQDVEITSERPMPYQVGGDAAGERETLRFSVAEQPLPMLQLGERVRPARHPLFGLLPPPRRA